MSSLESIYTTLADLEHIPEDTYSSFPSVISEQLDKYSLREERDVYISGALGVLSGCLPNVQVQYGRSSYHPNLYIFVVAPAGGGKGVLTDAEDLARPVHRKLLQESKAAQAQWEERQEENEDEQKPEPPIERLILPGNTSTAALIEALIDNDGRALMVETEADTMSQTMEKEWGNFSDILRKAHPHETISSGRLGKIQEVERPRLSVVLSGTPDQLPRLAREVGNGLWSRLCPYGFIPTTEWKDVTPSYAGEDESDKLFDLSPAQEPGQEVKDLYQALNARSKALQIRLRDEQWMRVNARGQKAKTAVHEKAGYDGDAVAHRMGIHVLRIASILAVWSRWDGSGSLDDQTYIYVGDESLETALQMAELYARHNVRLLEAVSGANLGAEVGKLERRWFKSLPTQFQTSEAVDLAGELQIAERTAKRRLGEWTEEGILDKLKQGHYEKSEDDS